MKAPQVTHMTRHKHLLHMNRVLPLLAILFCLQCLFIPNAFPELQLGNLYFMMAVMLCFSVFGLYLYDTQVNIFIKDHELFWQIPWLKLNRRFALKELHTIDVFDAAQPFSNMKLHFHKKVLTLYFIDDPTNMVKKLWQAKQDSMQTTNTSETKAA